MKRLLPLIAALILLSPQAHAWGRKGHAAVADLAAANLTPAAQAQVTELLKGDLNASGQPSGRATLAEVASWADEIRDVAPKGTYKGWHTRSNPVCGEGLGGCKRGECVDRKIVEYTAILKDRSQPHRARNEALKWVVHLIGDLHMPLHSGSNKDSAGQKIEVRLVNLKTGKNPNLHTVWDSELAVLALKQGPLAAKLTTSAPLAEDAPEQWMQETRAIARKHVYDPLPGFACGDQVAGPVELDAPYQQQAVPAIREQMTKAGLRLAQWLNQALQ